MAKDVPMWRQWVSEKLNPVQPSIAAQEPFSSPENIVDFKKAYREIEIVHRSVDIIINALIEVPIVVEGGPPAKKVHKLISLKPNPFEDRVRLFRRAFLDFFLDGNAFFYYDKETEGNALYVIPANDMEIVPDEKAFVSHYNYLLRNKSESDLFGYGKSRKAESIQFLPNEIIHVKSENEESIFRGYSRLRPCERLFELYYYMINFQRQFFKNNAVPGFVLTTENVLSQKIKYRLLESWRQSYTSLFNGARSPAILDGGLKIDKFSQVNFNELDFENSIERIQQDMGKALGVPYVLLKSGNNANIAANQVLFYNHTILPILEQFCSAFSHFFNNNISVRPDKTAILALQPDNRTQAIYYSTLVNTGIITPNEAREGLRFDKIIDEDSDNIRIPQNITGSATDATQGGRPSAEEDISGEAETEDET